ncbi:integrase core domain-containing protein [Streptomyces sp. P9-A2]|uniref:integrase core domain-containing protein n=1 Tax=Streptomyces sp. P9-A2 TaxID=3072284 RepID=UPI002FC8DE04
MSGLKLFRTAKGGMREVVPRLADTEADALSLVESNMQELLGARFPASEYSTGPVHGRRTGQCWDNALGESFFATLKRELIGERSWPNRSAVRTAIFEWLESWYSIRRLHSSLGYRSPAEYETILAA